MDNDAHLKELSVQKNKRSLSDRQIALSFAGILLVFLLFDVLVQRKLSDREIIICLF